MKLSLTIDQSITAVLTKSNLATKFPDSEGRLTGSMLGWPLQWQILKALGVAPSPLDEYTLRRFQRGHDVEAWLVKHIPGLVDTQMSVEYRGCRGHIDVMADTSEYDFPCGVIPFEVKSVANAKFAYITKQKKPDRSHLLQGCFYAVGKRCANFGVIYVASDDYRIYHWIFDTSEFSDEVEQKIDRFQAAWKKYELTGEVPVFEPEEKWQADPKYNMYKEWAGLTSEQLKVKVKEALNG